MAQSDEELHGHKLLAFRHRLWSWTNVGHSYSGSNINCGAGEGVRHCVPHGLMPMDSCEKRCTKQWWRWIGCEDGLGAMTSTFRSFDYEQARFARRWPGAINFEWKTKPAKVCETHRAPECQRIAKQEGDSGFKRPEALARASKTEGPLSCLNRLFHRSRSHVWKGGLLRYFGRQGLLFVSMHLRQRFGMGYGSDMRHQVSFGQQSHTMGVRKGYTEREEGKKRERVDGHGLKLYAERLRLS